MSAETAIPHAPLTKIIHIDMDAFYASVEQRDRPELRNRPVIVGGDPKNRGVVASCSYEARKFGVRSAMSAAKAQRLCPQAVFVRPDFSRYRDASDRMHEIFASVTPIVEPLSLDEAYLDVTENLLNEPLASRVARHIKDRIRAELGLTASAGVGPNKFIAKVASDLKKPDGLVVVPPEKVLDFVEKLAVERFWGVGPATAKELHALGLFTAADIRKRKPAELERALGKFGLFIYGLAFGQDSRKVEAEREHKSCGSETTFDKDIDDPELLCAQLRDLAEEVASSLCEISRPGRTVTLKLRYSDFQTITRSKTVSRFMDDAASIEKIARALLLEQTEAGSRRVRLLGISVSGLLDLSHPIQLYLDLPEFEGQNPPAGPDAGA